MRTFISLFFLSFVLHATAQDWALLNPAYRYNYSLGGTDTITNQVFVTQIDTLGTDDLLLNLNGVVKVCDTCSTDIYEMRVWPDAPQWLGGQVRITNDVWHFTGNGERVIMPLADAGSTWLYDTLNNVWAEIGAVMPATTFDLPDEHRTIALSNGDSLLLSRDHGILVWDSGHELIGINGPQLGRTIPTLAEFFPYTAGDLLQYDKGYGLCDGVGGCESRSSEFKFTVESGDEQDSTIVWEGWLKGHNVWSFQLGGIGSQPVEVHDYYNSTGQWTSGIPELPWAELLFSYPGQLINRTHFMDSSYGIGTNACIAEHRVDTAGRYVIGCRTFQNPIYQSYGHFFWYGGEAPGPNGTIPLFGPEDYGDIGDPQAGVTYIEGFGLLAFSGFYFETGEHYWLRGLMLDGDTVYGSFTDDSILLGLNDPLPRSNFQIAPNPANDFITIEGLANDAGTLLVMDAAGRTQLTRATMGRKHITLDVSTLPPGIYLLRAADGTVTRRFAIVR